MDNELTHATFVIDRVLAASPARVFAAYASLEAKSAWFKAPADVETLNRDFDFSPGGKERFHARWPDGKVTDFQATYHDIVDGQRIILVYDMYHNGDKLSVSLLTLEMKPEGDKTRLIHTEQGCYLVGGQQAVVSREHGTTWQIENLIGLLEAEAAGS